MGARSARPLALLALAAAALTLGAVVLTGGSGRPVTAVFEQAHGLVTGAEVRAAGLTVGRVTDIDLDGNGLPRVRMEVDDGYRLRRGATAELRFFSVAGEVNRYVMLHQGDGPELDGEVTLGSERTDEPVEIDQVLSLLDPGTRRDVRELLAAMDRGVRGRGGDIERALEHSADALGQTAEVLAAVRGDGRSIRTLIDRSRRVIGALAADPGSLGAATDEMAALLGTAAARAAELQAGVGRLGPGLRSPRLALERTRASLSTLRGLVADARPVASRLVGLAGDLEPVLGEARPTLRDARRLVRTAPADLRRLDPLLRSAGPVLERLDPVLERSNPILDQLRVRLPDVFAFFANWADFTSNYDANGHGARIGLVYSPPPPTPIGPSDATPGQLAAPFARTPGVLENEPWNDFEQSFVGSGR